MIWIQMDKWLFPKSHHQVGGTLDIHWNLKSQILDKAQYVEDKSNEHQKNTRNTITALK